MSYTKNIAVIKGLQGGFSADGGALSGLIKAEKYSSELRVEVSLINFAPLTEGRYVVAISDGPHTQIIEGGIFEGQSDVDTSKGFAAAVCFVGNGVQLIASAVCGNFHAAAFGLKTEVERAEKIKPTSKKEQKSAALVEVYEDEALAEENYYEFDAPCEGGQPVCEDKKEEEDGCEPCPNEESIDSVAPETQISPEQSEEAEINPEPVLEEPINLARGGFYQKMREEVEGLLSAYPPAEELCAAIEGSKWVKISYGESFYVFGVIFSDGVPKYICYGIPASDETSPPASMQGLASFLGVKTEHGAGFWVMYQDADTGASVRIELY